MIPKLGERKMKCTLRSLGVSCRTPVFQFLLMFTHMHLVGQFRLFRTFLMYPSALFQ